MSSAHEAPTNVYGASLPPPKPPVSLPITREPYELPRTHTAAPKMSRAQYLHPSPSAAYYQAIPAGVLMYPSIPPKEGTGNMFQPYTDAPTAHMNIREAPIGKDHEVSGHVLRPHAAKGLHEIHNPSHYRGQLANSLHQNILNSSSLALHTRPELRAGEAPAPGQVHKLPKLTPLARPTERSIPAMAGPSHPTFHAMPLGQIESPAYPAQYLASPTPPALRMDMAASKGPASVSTVYSETALPGLPSQIEIGRAAEHAFQTLAPLMKMNKMGDLHVLLVEILKHCDDLESIEDYYELLLNPIHTVRKYAFAERFHTLNISQPTHFQLKGLKLCFLILAFLRLPKDTICHVGGETIDDLKRPAIDPHEFSRAFFAIRILRAAIKEGCPQLGRNSNISRECVYKAYSILCQRLILRKLKSTSPAVQMKQLILGRTQIQKFSKLAFPNLVQKKFQRRGDPRFYYIGACWNDEIVDQATKEMILMDVTDVMSYEEQLAKNNARTNPLGDAGPQFGVHPTRILPAPPMAPAMPSLVPSNIRTLIPPLIPPLNLQLPKPNLPPINVKRTPPVIPPITPPLFSRKPLSTFVGPTTSIPKKDCTPRDWSRESGKIPKHTRWALTVMQKSLNSISRYGIRGDWLVRNFKAGDFSTEGATSLPDAVLAAMARLKEVSAPSKSYLHLYRVVIMLILPAVTASDAEISSEKRANLRACLKRMSKNLESEPFFESEEEQSKLHVFIETVRSMLLLDELKQASVKTEHFEEIIRVLCLDIDQLRTLGDGLGDDVFRRSLDTLVNDFGFDLPKLSAGNENDEDIVKALHQMRGVFTEHLTLFKESVFEILHKFRSKPPQESVQYLAYELSMMQIKTFHDVSFRDPVITQFPLCVFTFLLLLLMIQIQNLSFYQFGDMGPQLSRLSYEAWYVACSLSHEYLRAICEIIALNEELG